VGEAPTGDRCIDIPPPCTPPSYYMTIERLASYIALARGREKREKCRERVE